MQLAEEVLFSWSMRSDSNSGPDGASGGLRGRERAAHLEGVLENGHEKLLDGVCP